MQIEDGNRTQNQRIVGVGRGLERPWVYTSCLSLDKPPVSPSSKENRAMGTQIHVLSNAISSDKQS